MIPGFFRLVQLPLVTQQPEGENWCFVFTVWQYKACWRRIQVFLQQRSVTNIFENTVLDFLLWLADSTNMTLATISGHYAALSDPMVQIPERALSLRKKGIRSGRVQERSPSQAWSLQCSTVPRLRGGHHGRRPLHPESRSPTRHGQGI